MVWNLCTMANQNLSIFLFATTLLICACCASAAHHLLDDQQNDQIGYSLQNKVVQGDLSSVEVPSYDGKKVRRKRPQGKQANPGYGSVRNGVGTGYLRMRPGQVVTIQSTNYGVGNYFNNEGQVWKFFGQQCIISAQCPCSDIPLSNLCLEDYLKISDMYLFNQRFCGELKPNGTYHSATNNLKIKFRSNWRDTGSGFLCYVSCAAAGQADYALPTNVQCPPGIGGPVTSTSSSSSSISTSTVSTTQSTGPTTAANTPPIGATTPTGENPDP